MQPRTIPSPATLDKWDIAFIRHFKSGNQIDLNALCVLWAERVGMDVSHFHLVHIAEYVANLIDRLNLTPDLFTTINALHSDNLWKVGCPANVGESSKAIYVMASWLRLTEVKYLPGYREAIEAEDRLHAALDRDDIAYPPESDRS